MNLHEISLGILQILRVLLLGKSVLLFLFLFEATKGAKSKLVISLGMALAVPT